MVARMVVITMRKDTLEFREAAQVERAAKQVVAAKGARVPMRRASARWLVRVCHFRPRKGCRRNYGLLASLRRLATSKTRHAHNESADDSLFAGG